MGVPTLVVVAEIFIKYLENTNIVNIFKTHHITDYYKYFNGILIIYNEDTRNTENTLTFNSTP